MRKRPTNADRLCDVLNGMGIRTTNVGRTARRRADVRTPEQVEDARRQSL
jgi:hypothetical protein